MKKTLIAILAASVVILLFWISAYKQEFSDGSAVCFFDNASFGEFTDKKTEEFVIGEDTTIHFIMRGEIKDGELYVKVCSKDGEVIFENSDLVYDKEFDMELKAGTYYYILDIKKCIEGTIYNKAERK